MIFTDASLVVARPSFEAYLSHAKVQRQYEDAQYGKEKGLAPAEVYVPFLLVPKLALR
jgi:hypothetical protein